MSSLVLWAAMVGFLGDGKPNVVLIVADDLGGADLGCYGSSFHRTPNLDRMAKEGRRFTRFYASAPVCSPTRSSLMTGKHPARLHLTDWLPGRADRPDQRLLRPKFRQELPLEEVTLAEAFKANGYATGHIGKWHLGGKGFGPKEQGFDVNIAGDETGTPMSYMAPFGRNGRTMTGLEKADKGEYVTDRLAGEAEKFIEANAKRPFFLYLPHFAVHTPMVAPEETVAKYPKWDGTPHGKQENPTYAAMLEHLDKAVGRVLAKLEDLKIGENTIVVFTSDNGGLATREGPKTPATNNGPYREGKGYLYEGGIRVPMIIRWAGKISPGADETPGISCDLPPTLAALAGLEKNPLQPLDGVSLAGHLLKGDSQPARALYWHYPHTSNQGGTPSGAVQEGDWKLIEFYETGRRELFQVGKDFRESSNVAEAEPKRVEELAAKLDAWRKAVGAQMPGANPGYVPNPPGKDGVITMPARSAVVHGSTLRYEPLPHKNTLGYWVKPTDWASFEFTVAKAGTYRLQPLVGCGNGSGGSVVEFKLGDQAKRLTVPVTGGFQAFKPQDLGTVELKAGRQTLEVRPVSKPGLAVMDLREVRLIPE